MATVYKRKATYWIRFQWHGNEIRRSAHTSSKHVAQKYLAKVLEEHRKLDRGGRVRRTYKEALERFAYDYLPNLKPSTQERYRTSFRKLQPVFGNLYLDEITRSRLADYASDRMKAGAKGATVRRDLAAFSSVMSCAVAWDYIETNPIRQFSKRHIKEAPPRMNYPSAEQVDRLVAAASPMGARIIRLLAETGMRLDEACSLEWSQVSIPRREIRLTKTKTSSPRVVPLSDVAIDTLTGTPRHITAPYVFWRADGQRYMNFANSFARIARKAGVPFRCHDLRHAFASNFVPATGNIPALQAILGHKTIAMTMRYAHMVTSHLHQAMTEFAAKSGAKAVTTPALSTRTSQPDSAASD